MNRIKKSIIVNSTAEEMFNLVTDIPNYPKYLPWCSDAKIISHDGEIVIGAVYIEYLKIKTYFITKNTNTKFSNIKVELVEGPFTSFAGGWFFTPIGDSGCKIEFVLEYKFSNFLLEKMIGPVFNYITKNIVECFVKEASKQKTQKIIGKK